MEAVGNSGGALIHCSAQLRSWAVSEVKAKKEDQRGDDDEIVRTAVSNDGMQLLNASPRLRGDRGLVLLALSNSGSNTRDALK